MPLPETRVAMALDLSEPALHPDPTWTSLDEISPTLVAGYSIERGRQFELDRCDTGRAVVTIWDRAGMLDATNPAGLLLDPLRQVVLSRRNPVTGEWDVRFRGFLENLDYDYDPSGRVVAVQMSLVDIFEIVSVIEMLPGEFGDPPPKNSAGQVFYEDGPQNPYDHDGMQIRVNQVLGNCGISADWFVCFSGNIKIQEAVYSPGESAMTAIQDAADAEFPAVSNVYGDRFGRLAIHGRYARFDPEGTAATVTPDRWDFRSFKAGDGAAVHTSPTDTAQIRAFSKTLGLAKLINRTLAMPKPHEGENQDGKIEGQIIENPDSVSQYGIRSWSALNLLTEKGVTDGFDRYTECRSFADYYMGNYSVPVERPSAITFRSMRPEREGAAANWLLLGKCDIADRVRVTMASVGGAGIVDVPFYIEGIHEEVRPLQPEFDDVTLTLDLSPAGYYEDNPFPPLPEALATAAKLKEEKALAGAT